MWPCLGNEHQQWYFDESPNYQLVYAASLGSNASKCVDLMGGDLTNGQPLQIWDCAQTKQQTWAWDSKASMVYLAATGSAENLKCMDLRNGGMDNGTNVQVWDCLVSGPRGLALGCNQQWLVIHPAPTTVPSLLV